MYRNNWSLARTLSNYLHTLCNIRSQRLTMRQELVTLITELALGGYYTKKLRKLDHEIAFLDLRIYILRFMLNKLGHNQGLCK